MTTPLTLLSVDGLVLNASPYAVTALDFPDAELLQFGRVSCYESDYSDAPWQLTVRVKSPTDDLLDALYAVMRRGAVITIQDVDALAAASCAFVSVKTSAPVFTPNYAYIMFTGDRRPGWRKASWPFALTATDGLAQLPTVGGGMAADMDLYATTAGASTYLSLGIRPNPATGYDPFDGSGSYGSDVALSGTAAAVWAGSELDVPANRGAHIGIATLKHSALSSASSLAYSLQSTILDSTASTAPVASATTGTGDEVVIFDPLPIPSAPLPPNSGSGTIYGAPAVDQVTTVDADPTSGTTTITPNGQSQTFTVGVTGLLSGIELYGACAKGGSFYEMSASVSRAGSLIGTIAHRGGADEWATAKWRVLMPTSDIPVIAGETLTFSVTLGGAIRYSTTSIYDGGSIVGGTGDIVFRTYVKPELSFSAKTPIVATCSEGSQTAAFLSLARIPADAGCVIYVGDSGAGEGLHYSAATRSFFPAAQSGVIGTALDPIRRGVQFAPLPGENTLVVATDGGTVTLAGTITEVSLRRG